MLFYVHPPLTPSSCNGQLVEYKRLMLFSAHAKEDGFDLLALYSHVQVSTSHAGDTLQRLFSLVL
ncbi:MAG: hypothetical protein NVS4B12_15880 [Ktedonobacteraceae bacterium]